MNIPEEIEKLKAQLRQTDSEHKEAELILELLNKYASTNSNESAPYIDRLLEIADKINSVSYRAWGLYFLGVRNDVMDEYDASLNSNHRALTLFEQINDKQGIANVCQNIGITYYNKGMYHEALQSYGRALELKQETGDKPGIAHLYIGIGVVRHRQGNYPEALKNYFRSLQIIEEIGDKPQVASCYLNIGVLHHDQGNYTDSLNYYLKALAIYRETGDKKLTATVYNNLANSHYMLGNYPDALNNHLASLKIRENIGDKRGMAMSYNNIGSIHHLQGNYSEAMKTALAGLQIYQELGDRHGMAALHESIGAIYEMQGDYKEAVKNKLLSIKYAGEIANKDLIKTSSLSLSNSYKVMGDFESALKYHERYHQVESELLGEQAQKQLIDLNFTHNLEQKEKQLEIEHLRNVELKQERDRSENLLLNILPQEVALELKEKGAAAAKHFDDVTVLFTDFKDFTKVSERLPPQELVDELHACFSAFDEIITRYNIEKIKTVGDAYLAVSGLPVGNPNHAEDMVRAAIKIREYMGERLKVRGENTFQIRIGAHSGSVVAGIVGVKKFAYDIWGDTVNTAARMEQNSETGKINISQTTYELVKDKFNCSYRGEIEAKNKGMLKMYFVA